MQYITGLNFVTGTHEYYSAYRSELAGILGFLSVLSALVKHFNITTGSITLALDGKSALIQASGDWPLNIDKPCFNYIQDI